MLNRFPISKGATLHQNHLRRLEALVKAQQHAWGLSVSKPGVVSEASAKNRKQPLRFVNFHQLKTLQKKTAFSSCLHQKWYEFLCFSRNCYLYFLDLAPRFGVNHHLMMCFFRNETWGPIAPNFSRDYASGWK